MYKCLYRATKKSYLPVDESVWLQVQDDLDDHSEVMEAVPLLLGRTFQVLRKHMDLLGLVTSNKIKLQTFD